PADSLHRSLRGLRIRGTPGRGRTGPLVPLPARGRHVRLDVHAQGVGRYSGRRLKSAHRRRFLMLRLFLAAALILAPLASPLAGGNQEVEQISQKDGVIRLLNGKDLTGLYTWLKDTQREDPGKVFTVADGLLHISGDGYGYVATDKPYRD